MISRPTAQAANDGAPGTVNDPHVEQIHRAVDYSTDPKWAAQVRRDYGLPEHTLLERFYLWLTWKRLAGILSVACLACLIGFALGRI